MKTYGVLSFLIVAFSAVSMAAPQPAVKEPAVKAPATVPKLNGVPNVPGNSPTSAVREGTGGTQPLSSSQQCYKKGDTCDPVTGGRTCCKAFECVDQGPNPKKIYVQGDNYRWVSGNVCMDPEDPLPRRPPTDLGAVPTH